MSPIDRSCKKIFLAFLGNLKIILTIIVDFASVSQAFSGTTLPHLYPGEHYGYLFTYEAKDLFQWLTTKEDIVVVDVRNEKDFNKFHVESPYPFPLHNISYYEFMEDEEGSVARVPKGSRVRIVCAKEGSAKYVAEIFEKFGYDVGYLTGGIKTWGNLLVPKLLTKGTDYELYQFIRPGKASCSYGLICGKEMMLFDPSRNVDFYLGILPRKRAAWSSRPLRPTSRPIILPAVVISPGTHRCHLLRQ